MIYLAKDLTDNGKNNAKTRNIRAELNITNNLPFISRSQLLGYKEKTTAVNNTPSTIEYNMSIISKYQPVPTEDKFVNGLVEIDDSGNVTDRFVPITIIPSIKVLPEMQLYYDKKNGVYLIIPAQYDVSENDTDLNVMTGNTITIEAYNVGTHATFPIKTYGELFSKELITCQNINKLTDCKIHLLLDTSDDGYQKKLNIGEMFNNDYLEYINNKSNIIVSLGGDNHLGVKLPVYKSLQTNFQGREYRFVGEVSVNDYAIQLPL